MNQVHSPLIRANLLSHSREIVRNATVEGFSILKRRTYVPSRATNSAKEGLRPCLYDVSCAQDKARLEEELGRAKAEADVVRYGLLYGTGKDLVDAVVKAITAAGFTMLNLDDALGATKSADLLATHNEQRRLIEIKSASGNAPESLVGHLERHLKIWPQLRSQDPVDGGALIVDHQHKLEPHERSRQVYNRPEFVDSLTVPVISTRAVFDWSRACDWPSLRSAVLSRTGQPAKSNGAPPTPPGASRLHEPGSAPPIRNRRPMWKRRG